MLHVASVKVASMIISPSPSFSWSVSRALVGRFPILGGARDDAAEVVISSSSIPLLTALVMTVMFVPLLITCTLTDGFAAARRPAG